jgi:hypothetical protein
MAPAAFLAEAAHCEWTALSAALLLAVARWLALLAERLTPIHPVRPLYLRAPDAKPQDGHSLMRVSPP